MVLLLIFLSSLTLGSTEFCAHEEELNKNFTTCSEEIELKYGISLAENGSASIPPTPPNGMINTSICLVILEGADCVKIYSDCLPENVTR